MPFFKKQISDKNNSIPKPYLKNSSSKTFQKKSFYLSMRDGVKLAIDVFLPADITDKKLPTILHQTRYWRKMRFKYPFSIFFNALDIRTMDKIRTYFVQRDYAWVNVDVRGTGASFGYWKHPWWKEEVKDGAEVVDWIIQQPWSNQSVGTTGISYAGTSAEFLLVNHHPNVKACIPKFSLFDVYDDIVFPGGTFLKWFVENWEMLNAQLDQNQIPKESSALRFLIQGVSPIEEPEMIQKALKDHTQNTNIAAEARDLTFRDDLSPGIGEKMDSFSPHHYLKAINDSQVPVYCWSGWADGTYQHAAIKRFMSLTHPGKKLLLGPWDHGGRFNIDAQEVSRFDRYGEMMKFFDFYLKGIDNDILREKPVHYYTMQEGKWKAADSWPPPESKPNPIYLSENQLLILKPEPQTEYSFTEYQTNLSFGSGKYTRFTALTGLNKTARIYSNWTNTSASLLHFVSEKLDDDLEITGHPWAKIFLSTDVDDGNIFIYLQDLQPNGKVRYITEGNLRLIHRKAFAQKDIHQDAIPLRSYHRNQMKPITPDEIMEVAFDLLPTSYLFKKGHQIRISISGADKDFFAINTSKAPKFKIYHDKTHTSHILLPIVK